MKTITMDFATYQQELQEERTIGTGLSPQLKEKLIQADNLLHPHCSMEEFHKAKRMFSEVIQAMEGAK